MGIPFFEDLRDPAHHGRLWNAGGAVDSGVELAIAPGWRILVRENASDQVMIAAEDLRRFLDEGADLDIPVERCALSQAAPPDAICLFPAFEKQDETVPESYGFVCNERGIVIEGADDSAIMQGVFHLEEQMRFRKAPCIAFQDVYRKPWLETRIFRSPMAFYYHEELEQVHEAYPDNYLLKLARHGFNGIWLRGILRDLARVEPFPEFGRDSAPRLEALNALIERCRKYGIKVFLYFTEPLGFLADSKFFDKHPHVRGESLPGQSCDALCSSCTEVQAYLEEGMRYLFEHAKGLGGVILITASEHHSHCYSHSDVSRSIGVSCPRCRDRLPQDVVAEIITLINRGVKSADPSAKVIAWNWSWYLIEPDPQRDLIAKLPRDVIVMADFERGSKRNVDGFEHVVNEYSLSYVGPSERFRNIAATALDARHDVYAKLQIGVTHEVADVPWFPVMQKLARKFVRLHEERATGAMECWNFGNILSHNTELANMLSWEPFPDNPDKVLNRLAIRDFGETAADMVVRAWQHFCDATDHFPFYIPLLYVGPVNHGGAYPLFLERQNRPMPSSWLLPKEVEYNCYFKCMENTEYGDDLSFCGEFGIERTITCFDRMCEEWEKGVILLQQALAAAPSDCLKTAKKEHVVAKAVLSQFLSARNFIEFTHLRNTLKDQHDENERRKTVERLMRIASNEIDNSLILKELTAKEPTLGFHGEAFGYLYNPRKIDKKIEQVKRMLEVDLELIRSKIMS